MSERFIRNCGTLYNMENNFVNRSFAEQMDDHQMAMYELLKTMFPEAIGYEAIAHEADDGGVTTKFNILMEKEEKGEKNEQLDTR